MIIATITPSRGDRPQFLEFAKFQIEQQTIKPELMYIVDFYPAEVQADLTKRIRIAIEMAKVDGAEAVIIWEDDDAYDCGHIETLLVHLRHYDFVGYQDTLYYHLKNRTWMHQNHPGRSSLFCTAFKLSAIEDFLWPADHYLWLDLRLWEHARDKKKTIKLLSGNPNTGIKHGKGLCAGKSHYKVLENSDKDLSFLKSRLEEYQFEFYSKLKL